MSLPAPSESDSARGKTPDRAAAKPVTAGASPATVKPAANASAAKVASDKKTSTAAKKDAKESAASATRKKKGKEQEKTDAELAEELAKQMPAEPTEGKGLFEFANGARYNGEWKTFDGKKKRHGQGVFTSGGDEYRGEWTEDAITGRGVYTFTSGGVYDGQLRDGRFEGEGRYTFPSGACYMGQWRDNRMHGDGCFLTANGDRYRGTFQNDRFLQKDGSWAAPIDQLNRKL